MKAHPRPQAHAGATHVLISGGAGFIGSRLARELLEGGARVTLVDDGSAGTLGRLERLEADFGAPRLDAVVGDVTLPGVWSEALDPSRGRLDAIVHLAGCVGVKRVLGDPAACRRANVHAARELVAALRSLPRAQRPRLFAASSSEVYADGRGPLCESAEVRPTTGDGRWAYAGSKRLAESTFDAARELWPRELGPVHLRFFNVVGPGQDASAGMVLPTFIERALTGRALPIHGDGRQIRTFGHVDDVARALAGIVVCPDFPEGALNLGGSARTDVLGLARAVLRASGRTASIDAALRFVDPRERVARTFEEVAVRLPSLERARRLGVPLAVRSLDAIVRDSVRRHADEALRPFDFGARRAVCGSPGS